MAERLSGYLLAAAFPVISLSALFVSLTPANEWPEVRVVPPFLFRADFPLDGVEPLQHELAELQVELSGTLRLPPPPAPIEVYLFRDEPTYRRYLKKLYPQIPFRRALYIKEKGVGRLFAHAGPQFEVDVRHEAVHALLHAVLANVPLWLDEGLAVYFELPAEKRLHENPYFSSLMWNLRFGMLPSLERLEPLTDAGALTKANYRDCWAWTHFLLNGPPAARDELLRYLRDLQTLPSPVPLHKRLVHRIPELSRQLKTHLATLANRK